VVYDLENMMLLLLLLLLLKFSFNQPTFLELLFVRWVPWRVCCSM